MTLPVIIDCCAWNYLFDCQVDLTDVFPRDEYAIFITREVEIELRAIPDKGKDGTDKRALKSYIAESIKAHRVRTSSIFGFASLEPDGSLSEVQVYGGFGQGTFQSQADRSWYSSGDVRRFLDDKRKKNSGLIDNQADASLAVRSFDSLVLTNEFKSTRGPLHLASEHGGRVIYIEDVEQSGLSLKEYIASVKKPPPES
jgi:hypothetical protein